MRNLVAAMLLTVGAAAAAQEGEPAAGTANVEPRPQNVASVNVLSNIFGAYSVEYARVLSPTLALFVEPTFFNFPTREGFNLGITGPGLVLGAHYFPFGTAPGGLFFAPEVYVTYLDSGGDAAGSAPGGGVGLIAGWTFIVFRYLAISLGAGVTANLFGYGLSGYPGLGWTPVIRANLGVAF